MGVETQIINGVTGDQVLGPAHLHKVRVGGTAALAGTVQIKKGATVVETLAAATAVGVEREFLGAYYPDLRINPSSAADTVIVVRS